MPSPIPAFAFKGPKSCEACSSYAVWRALSERHTEDHFETLRFREGRPSLPFPVNQKTFATHPWIAIDARGNCFRDVFMPDPDGGPENNNFQVWFD